MAVTDWRLRRWRLWFFAFMTATPKKERRAPGLFSSKTDIKRPIQLFFSFLLCVLRTLLIASTFLSHKVRSRLHCWRFSLSWFHCNGTLISSFGSAYHYWPNCWAKLFGTYSENPSQNAPPGPSDWRTGNANSFYGQIC